MLAQDVRIWVVSTAFHGTSTRRIPVSEPTARAIEAKKVCSWSILGRPWYATVMGSIPLTFASAKGRSGARKCGANEPSSEANELSSYSPNSSNVFLWKFWSVIIYDDFDIDPNAN